MSHTNLGQVRWIVLPTLVDHRGVLTVIEGGETVPFEIKRAYVLHQIEGERGGHAHRETQQLMVALSGTFDLSLSNGREELTYQFCDRSKGLYIPPMLFIRLTRSSHDAVVMVLASTHYDKARSIRSWEDYIAEVA